MIYFSDKDNEKDRNKNGDNCGKNENNPIDELDKNKVENSSKESAGEDYRVDSTSSSEEQKVSLWNRQSVMHTLQSHTMKNCEDLKRVDERFKEFNFQTGSFEGALRKSGGSIFVALWNMMCLKEGGEGRGGGGKEGREGSYDDFRSSCYFRTISPICPL